MKAETKKARLAALFGLELPDPQLKRLRQNVSREGEAVLAYYAEPLAFTEKMCKHCNRMFAVNRGQVGYCSDRCRVAALAAIGIKYDVEAPIEQRWGAIEPLVVVPEALPLVQQAVSQKSEPRESENSQAPVEAEGLESIDDYLSSLGLP